MAIYFIRHAKVQFEFDNKYNSREYLKAVESYDASEIEKIPPEKIESINRILPADYTLFTSTMKRSKDTAAQLFPNQEAQTLEELNEVMLYPYTDTNKRKPFWKWKVFGRIQFFLNSKRQLRNKSLVETETDSLIKKFYDHENLVIVGHGFQLNIMLSQLHAKGFNFVDFPGFKPIKNLEVIECTDYPDDAPKGKPWN